MLEVYPDNPDDKIYHLVILSNYTKYMYSAYNIEVTRGDVTTPLAY